MSLYKDASLVMIPSAYKDGRLYSIRPVEQLGDELVTNGSFDTDSDWTKGTGSTISGGSLNIVSAPYNANTKQTISLTNGTTYKISINYTAIGTATSNTFQLGFGDSSGNPTDTTQHEFEEGSGVKTLNVTAASGDATIIFRSRDAGTCDLSINSVSVKEVVTANGDFTFSRGSNLAATRVASSGYIQKGRENLFTNSDMTSGITLDQITRTTSQADPFGGTDAIKITESTATGNHRWYRLSATPTGVYTASFYAKYDSRKYVRVITANGGFRGDFNLIDGTIDDQHSGNIDATMVSVGNGWYRCSITGNGSGVNWIGIYLLDDSRANSYTGDGTSSTFLYGFQIEQGLVATDYIETGASTAQAGILEDMPRLDYSGGASCPALLLEPQRTNLVTQSEYLTNTTRSTITHNQATSPEGLQNAFLAVDSTDANNHIVGAGLANLGGTDTAVFSVFAKKQNNRYINLRITDDAASAGTGINFYNATFDLESGVVTDDYESNTPTNPFSDIEDVGNGWYRCWVGLTKKSGAARTDYKVYLVNSSSAGVNPTYQGTGNDGNYLYGYQLESGSYPTSYIPTYGASVTRSNEYFTTNVDLQTTGILGSTWTFLYDNTFVDVPRDTTSGIFQITDGTGNYVRITLNAIGSLRLQDSEGTIANSTNNKIVGRYDGTKVEFFGDGASLGSRVQGSGYDYSNLNAYSPSTLNSKKIKLNQLVFFPTALTDSECIALTTL